MYVIFFQCVTPVLSCEGWHIVTVEGLGSTKDGLHPIQERLAAFHGTQVCGEFLSLLDYSEKKVHILHKAFRFLQFLQFVQRLFNI